MNLQETLLSEHSRANTLAITAYIGSRPSRFRRLMELFLGTDALLAQRAAWVFSKVGEQHPHLIVNYLDALISQLDQAVHPAIQRNILSVLAKSKLTLTEDQEGLLVNYCFDLLINPKIPVAIRVYAMQCIANLLNKYPELVDELKTVIEDGLEHGSPGFKSRGNKILKQIHKMER